MANWSSSHKTVVGQKFGMLLAFQQLPRLGKKNRIYYRCTCDCGNEAVVLVGNLTSGKTKSCGCLRSINHIRLRPFEALYNVFIGRNEHRTSFTYENFLEFTKINTCHYCGEVILWKEYKTKGAYNLDRKDNELGYTKANCAVCCGACNRAKGDMFTYEEFMLLSPALKTIRQQRTNAIHSKSQG
jgi:hypothetical protein